MLVACIKNQKIKKLQRFVLFGLFNTISY